MSASYTHYAGNAMKWYFRHPEKPERFSSAANEQNWETCARLVAECDSAMVEIIREVYLSADTVGDAVYEAAKRRGINQENIWTMLAMIEKRFARERGLI